MADKHDKIPDESNSLMDDFGDDMFSSSSESAVGDMSSSFSGLGDGFGDVSGGGIDSMDNLSTETSAADGTDNVDSFAVDEVAETVATDETDSAELTPVKGKKAAKAKKEPKQKPVKPAKTPKEPKVRPPKEPSESNVGWLGVLCLMAVCLLVANGLMLSSGILLLVLVDILGILALSVPFLLWKAGQRYTIFDVLLGISVIALVIGSSILLAELASYDFTFKSAAVFLQHTSTV